MAEETKLSEAEIKAILFRIHTAIGGSNLISAVLASWQVIEYEVNPETNKIDGRLIDSQAEQIMAYLEGEAL